MPGAVDLYMTMLFTYQGMGNLVTLTDPGKPKVVKYNALFDFGTSSSTETTETVSFVAQFLTAKGTKDAVLDLAVVSHKDNDHWRLYDKLIEALGDYTTPRELKIKKLAFGGDKDTYTKGAGGKDVIDRLYAKLEEPNTVGNYIWYKPEGSAYADKPYLPLDNSNGVKVVPVAVNVAAAVSKKRKTITDIEANTVGLVVALIYLTKAIVLPADATANTIAYINGLFKAGRADEIKEPDMLSVPHHGALRTIASNFVTDHPDLDVAKEFADAIKAKTIGASAGFATHNHPHEDVLRLFVEHLLKMPSTHDYVSYFSVDNGWRATSTKECIFTTYTSVGTGTTRTTGKLGASKIRVLFIIDSTGTLKIGLLPVDQESLTAALAKRLMTGLSSTSTSTNRARHFVAMPRQQTL